MTDELNWQEMRHILGQHQMPSEKCIVCKHFGDLFDKMSDEEAFKMMDEDISKFRKVFCTSRCSGRTYCNGNFMFGTKRDLNQPFSQCKKYRYFFTLK